MNVAIFCNRNAFFFFLSIFLHFIQYHLVAFFSCKTLRELKEILIYIGFKDFIYIYIYIYIDLFIYSFS